MKKVIIYIALILLLICISIYVYSRFYTRSNEKISIEKASIEGLSTICQYEVKGNKVEFFIKGNKSKTITYEGDSKNYFLNDGHFVYFWYDGRDFGIKNELEPNKITNNNKAITFADSTDLNKDDKNCLLKSIDDSVFLPPENITFN